MSNLAVRSRRFGAGALALVTSVLVAVSGLLVVPAAAQAADGPEVSVSVSSGESLDPAADSTLTIEGRGFAGPGAENGVYVVFGAKSTWSGQGPFPSNWIAQAHVPLADFQGENFSAKLVVPAGKVDPAIEYVVATSAAHRLSATNRTLDTFTPISVKQPVVDPGSENPGGENPGSENPGGENPGGENPGGENPGGENPGGENPGGENPGIPTPAEQATAKLALSRSTVSAGNTTALHATVTVPTANASGASLSIGTLQFNQNGAALGAPVAVALPKGSASVMVSLAASAFVAGDVRDFNAVFTPNDPKALSSATTETVTATGVAKSGPWAPSIEVFLKLNGTLVPAAGQKVYLGDELVVKGTGFDPEANFGGRGVPIPLGAQGSYVVFSSFAKGDAWRPSKGAGADTRAANAQSQGWALSDEAFASVPQQYRGGVEPQLVRLDAAGSFEWSTTVTKPEKPVTNGQYGVYSYAAGGAQNAAQELAQPLEFVDETRAAATIVKLTASAATVSAGHQVGLNVTVSSDRANAGAAAAEVGKVQIFDGTEAIGTPQSVRFAANGKTASVGIVGPEFKATDVRNFRAVFTPADKTQYLESESASVKVSGTAATGPWKSSIEVFVKTSAGETPYAGQELRRGDEIVVRGSGFDPEANVGGRGVPVPVGPQGTYVVFGNFTENAWKPSAGNDGSARQVNGKTQGWVLSDAAFASVPAMYKPAVQAQLVRPNAAGDFEWSTKLKAPATLAKNGKFGVYTYAAGGATNAAEEHAVLVNFTDARRSGDPQETEISLKSSAATVSGDHSVGLTATVTLEDAIVAPDDGKVGEVQFRKDGVDFGNAVPVTVKAGTKAANAAIVTEPVTSGTKPVFTAVFTPNTGKPYTSAASGSVAVTGGPNTGPWNPQLQVFVKLDGKLVSAVGQKIYRDDEIVVKGTGFDPEANVGGYGVPVPVGAQGAYVVFSSFAPGDSWRPSTGAKSASRPTAGAKQGWLLSDIALKTIPEQYIESVRDQHIKTDATGSFTWSTRVTKPTAPLADGKYGVYVYPAGGAVNAAQELAYPVDFVDGVRPGNPVVEVFLADGKTKYTNQKLKEGDKLVVKGSGYDPYANKPAESTGGVPIPNALPQGTFVVFGSFAKDWRPSSGATSATRALAAESRAWLLAQDTFDAIPNGAAPENYRDQIQKQWVALGQDGTFETTITLKTPGTPVKGGNYGIYTYAGGAGQVTNSAQEQEVVVSYDDGRGGETTPEPVQGAMSWGIRGSFVSYIESNPDGKVATVGSAKRAGNVFNFAQATGGEWDKASATGEARYAGGVTFTAHGGALSLGIADPIIKVTDKNTAVMTAMVNNVRKPLVNIDLSHATQTTAKDGSLTWTGARTTLRAEAEEDFAQYKAGERFDDLTFTVGEGADVKPTEPTKPPVKPKPPVQPKPKPVDNQAQAGSLVWGVSSGFRNYTIGSIAKGSVSTSGVGAAGGAYLFPQTSGGSWDKASQTGSVQFSGVVTFTGHNGLMTESFANPVITVTGPDSGTISVGGRTFGLNLGAASKRVGANGEVTWTGVPVNGAITGGGNAGGASGGGSFGIDPLSFTVGVASGVSYGSTSETKQKGPRQAAATPPATEGIRMVTSAKDLVPGGEIEFVSSGFEANERDILVVLYSDPIVLDSKAGANNVGEVRWIGKLPEDIAPGKHTLTLQGSKNTGIEFTVVEKSEKKVEKASVKSSDSKSATTTTAPVAAAADTGAGVPAWAWWVGAVALLAVAGTMGGLVVRQRRQAASVDSSGSN